MKSRKITDGDIADKRVSSLPTRPTAPTAFGGKGYTPSEVKEAFDKLGLYIIERYNELIDDICDERDDGICGSIKTGIREGHTLSDMLRDITDGDFVGYLKMSGATLAEYLAELRVDVDKIASHLGISL